MEYQYQPKDVCAKKIFFTIDQGMVRNVRFSGGCAGNQTAVSRLVEGMPVVEVIRMLGGIMCGKRNTSCPDQLAIALQKEFK
ncbi:MAG: TIGR03905 family TSCPD domain-containing protein [Oscillospiraceae bacterium]|nr:TIGR03905 family TSCPD domain-containing protein [Oscillospiraceae bacterium]